MFVCIIILYIFEIFYNLLISSKSIIVVKIYNQHSKVKEEKIRDT